MLQFNVSTVDMLGESSKVALISTSFVLIEALGVDISRVQLGGISVKSNVCAVPFNEHDPIGSVQAENLNELQGSLYWYWHSHLFL